MNVGTLLTNALRGKPSRTCSSDVTVICGPVEIDPEDPRKQTAINPRLVVEGLSPSTEDHDRGEKLGHCKQIPTLCEVLLVAHDRREVEIVRREADGSWSREIARGDQVARLTSIGCELPVRDIYHDPLARRRPRRFDLGAAAVYLWPMHLRALACLGPMAATAARGTSSRRAPGAGGGW